VAEIRITRINKIYPDGTHAVKDVDLEIRDGEFMIMVGPSGCAKSTLLRTIAGLEVPTSGTIEIGGRNVTNIPPKDRDIAMVFQTYALYPHMTVAQNMAFGLKLRHMPPSEIDQRISDAARILGLEKLLHRKPKQLSGGQRQRVAMGRAIVREPSAFLMDEPLSNLDAKLRVQMRAEIAKLHQRLQTTTVYVTHDQVEALTLGQRICILRLGEIQQVDTPYMVYTNPTNVFVAGFIGSPGMNFFSARIVDEGHGVFLRVGQHHLPVPQSVMNRFVEPGNMHGRDVIAGIRPEHMHEAGPQAAQNGNTLSVHVELLESMGSETYAHYTADVQSPDLSALSDSQGSDDSGKQSYIAKLAPNANAQQGAPLLLEIEMDHVHLFDPRNQQTLLTPLNEGITQQAIVVHQPAEHEIVPSHHDFSRTTHSFVPAYAHARELPEQIAAESFVARPLLSRSATPRVTDATGPGTSLPSWTSSPTRPAQPARTPQLVASDPQNLSGGPFGSHTSDVKVFQRKPLFSAGFLTGIGTETD